MLDEITELNLKSKIKFNSPSLVATYVRDSNLMVYCQNELEGQENINGKIVYKEGIYRLYSLIVVDQDSNKVFTLVVLVSEKLRLAYELSREYWKYINNVDMLLWLEEEPRRQHEKIVKEIEEKGYYRVYYPVFSFLNVSDYEEIEDLIKEKLMPIKMRRLPLHHHTHSVEDYLILHKFRGEDFTLRRYVILKTPNEFEIWFERTLAYSPNLTALVNMLNNYEE